MLPYLMGELYLFGNCSVIQQDYQGRVVVVVVVVVVVAVLFLFLFNSLSLFALFKGVWTQIRQ